MSTPSRSLMRSSRPAVTRLLIALLLAAITFGGNAGISVAQNDGSSIESAIELGEVGEVGDFEITITDVDDDAIETVLDADSSNQDPAKGRAYVLISLEVTNTGTEIGDAGYGLSYQAVGQSGTGYVSYINYCGYLENDETSAGELEPDESAEFVVCWNVAEEDVESLIVYITPIFSDSTDTIWFSIGNDAPQFDAGEIPDDVVTENTNKDPIPFGGTGQIGDYLVTLVDVKADATDIVMDTNSFNEEPASGHQFYLLRVHVTYIGAGIGNPSFEMSYVSIGDSDDEYTTFDDSCGVVPEDEYSISDVFSGTEVEYNVCWDIDSEDADSLVLRVENFVDFEADPVWFSLEQD